MPEPTEPTDAPTSTAPAGPTAPTGPDGAEVVLLIAHGSRNPATAGDHEALCRAVAARSGAAVRPAYLELTAPSIPDAVDAAVAGGASTVRLVPFFLHVGNHVLRDLPAIAADAASRHPGVSVRLEEHTGADPRLVDLVADRLRTPRTDTPGT